MSTEPRTWTLTRLAVLLRDRATCLYCGTTDASTLHVDHVHPRSRGGSDDPSNLVTACKACNLDKAHLSLAIYVLHRAEQGQPVEGLRERVAAATQRPVDWTAAEALLSDARAERRAARKAA